MDKAEACAAGDLKSPGGSCRWASQNQQSPSFAATGSSWQVNLQAVEAGRWICGCGVWLDWVSAWCVCVVHGVLLFFVVYSTTVFHSVFADVLWLQSTQKCRPVWTATINQCTEQCVTTSVLFSWIHTPTHAYTHMPSVRNTYLLYTCLLLFEIIWWKAEFSVYLLPCNNPLETRRALVLIFNRSSLESDCRKICVCLIIISTWIENWQISLSNCK